MPKVKKEFLGMTMLEYYQADSLDEVKEYFKHRPDGKNAIYYHAFKSQWFEIV